MSFKDDYYAQQQILRRDTHAKFPYLIAIKHYTNADDHTEFNMYYYANSDIDIEFEGNTYTASVFSVQPPEKKSDGFSDAKISISAIDQEWIVKIRNTPTRAKRAELTFVAVIQYENGTEVVEAIEEEKFILTNASWNDESIEWTMKFDDLMDLQIPMATMDSRICPASV